jgi:hypothetical protein
LNSLLTAVDPDGERVDRSSVSPVLAALCDSLGTLRRGSDPPQLVVLGDLFELALSSTADAAATFAQMVVGLRLGADDAVVAPGIRFVPGNHDHHLWSRARGECYLEHIRQLPRTEALPPEAHATRLLPDNDTYPVRDRLIELLAARADTGATITVEQSYPNFGIVDPTGRRAVVLSHGHFIEPLYRAMSAFEDLRQTRVPEPPSAGDLEAENGAWIDFFWSSMGDSGDVGRWARKLYESLQSEAAIEAEIDAIRRAIVDRPVSRMWGHVEGFLLDGGLTAAVKRSLRRERHEPALLSEKGHEGLVSYLSGPVARQIDEEMGSLSEVAFVFGHTHKPFTDLGRPSGLPGPGTVMNTGGWVVDSIDPEPVKGGSVILIDEDLNIAALRCYGQGSGSGHGVVVEGPLDDPANPLVSELQSRIDPSRDPWRALAEAVTMTEEARRGQLQARLQLQTTELDSGGSKRHWGFHRSAATAPPSPPEPVAAQSPEAGQR